MKYGVLIAGIALVGSGWVCTESVRADEDQLAYAVVSEVPKDKTRISAKIAIDGTVTDTKLLASEAIANNLIWRKLEICHFFH